MDSLVVCDICLGDDPAPKRYQIIESYKKPGPDGKSSSRYVAGIYLCEPCTVFLQNRTRKNIPTK